MEFSKVIGNVDENLRKRAEEKLTSVFLDIASRYDNRSVGTQLGGDPLVFSLVVPNQHVCTMNLPTAATDGKFFYWNPEFVLKRSRKGLRFIATHEAWHAIYMHPSRIGSRNPRLFNICVDYIVNFNVLEDLRLRDKNAVEEFKKELGNFITVDELIDMIKNPFNHKDLLDSKNGDSSAVKMPHPGKESILSPEQKAELEKRAKYDMRFYADPNLKKEWQSPEKLYDYLLSLLPKCPECGKIGVIKNPNSKKDKSSDSGSNSKSDEKSDEKGSGQGDQNFEESNDSSGEHGHCGTCGHGGEYVDVFGSGGTVDDHMNSEESEEKMAQKIYDAMQTAKKMAGHIPAALEDEIGRLTDPKISWKDVVRGKMIKAKAGNQRNDWNRFRSRPMFAGLLVPKKVNFTCNFGCLLDTSGSMSKDGMSFGISQLQSLDSANEGTIVPADCSIYWDQATKIRKCDAENLKKIKVVGRGGTMFSDFFKNYEKNIGKCDFLIVITDGYLLDNDVASMIDPGIDVIWLLTDSHDFRAPFGRVFDLNAI